MKRIANSAILAFAAVVFLAARSHEVAAAELILNLVQNQSDIHLTGDFSPGLGALAFEPQEGTPGTVDGNPDPAWPSNRTTFQGWIKIKVNDVNNPSTIEILESAADADPSGQWFPQVYPEGNVNTAVPADVPPAMPADFAIELRHPSIGDQAYAVLRDVVYNITMGSQSIVGGTFSSTGQNFELGTPTPDQSDPDGTIIDPGSGGWFDYWLLATQHGRSDQTGGDDDNLFAADSSYSVTSLGNNKREIKLTIPIAIHVPRDDDGLRFSYDGQFVATLVVPEPSTFLLTGIAMAFAGALAARRRK